MEYKILSKKLDNILYICFVANTNNTYMIYNSENLPTVNWILFYGIGIVSALKIFFPKVKNLIINYYDQRILNFNLFKKKIFRESIFKIFTVKTIGEVPNFSNFLEIYYIQIAIEKSFINEANEIFRNKLKQFLLETEDEADKNIESFIEENNYFIFKINVRNMFLLYNEIFDDNLVTNNFTDSSVATVFMSLDICLQQYFGLSFKDYSIKSIGLNLHYMHSKIDRNLVRTYLKIVTNRQKIRSNNLNPQIYFDLDLFDYQIEDEEYLAVKCLLIEYCNINTATDFSSKTLYSSIIEFYSYLEPVTIAEMEGLDMSRLSSLNKFIIKTIKPFFEKLLLDYKLKY